MDYFFKIPEENILMFSTTRDTLCNHSFIVYIDNLKGDIRVNADFRKSDSGNYICCKLYDRPLCNTVSDFKKMTTEEIENQAYGAYMDGAR